MSKDVVGGFEPCASSRFDGMAEVEGSGGTMVALFDIGQTLTSRCAGDRILQRHTGACASMSKTHWMGKAVQRIGYGRPGICDPLIFEVLASRQVWQTIGS